MLDDLFDYFDPFPHVQSTVTTNLFLAAMLMWTLFAMFIIYNLAYISQYAMIGIGFIILVSFATTVIASKKGARLRSFFISNAILFAWAALLISTVTIYIKTDNQIKLNEALQAVQGNYSTNSNINVNSNTNTK